jgi:hypothetical protein
MKIAHALRLQCVVVGYRSGIGPAGYDLARKTKSLYSGFSTRPFIETICFFLKSTPASRVESAWGFQLVRLGGRQRA